MTRTNVSEIIISAALRRIFAEVNLFRPSDFVIKREADIWAAIIAAAEAGAVGLYEVQQHLSIDSSPAGGWEKVLKYYVSLDDEGRFEHYLSIFKEEVRRFRASQALSRAAEQIARGAAPESVWPELEQGEILSEALKIGDIVSFRARLMEERYAVSPDEFMSTGIPDLDAILTYKFKAGGTSVISARAKMGKSTLKLALILNLLRQGRRVYSWTPEIGRNLEIDILTSIGTGIDTAAMMNPKEGMARVKGYKEKIKAFDAEIQQYNLIIDDDPCHSIEELFARVQAVQGGVDILFLDNADNLGCIFEQPNAVQMSYSILRVLRKQQVFAVANKLHVCNLWQVSKNTEDTGRKKDRRPQLGDLAYSDAIIRVVDWILFVYRESYYKGGIDDGETELIVAAQRGGGKRGTARVFKDPMSERLIWRVPDTAPVFQPGM